MLTEESKLRLVSSSQNSRRDKNHDLFMQITKFKAEILYKWSTFHKMNETAPAASCQCHLKRNQIQKPLAVACSFLSTSILLIPSKSTFHNVHKCSCLHIISIFCHSFLFLNFSNFYPKVVFLFYCSMSLPQCFPLLLALLQCCFPLLALLQCCFPLLALPQCFPLLLALLQCCFPLLALPQCFPLY